MNAVFLAIVGIAFATAAVNQLFGAPATPMPMDALGTAMLDAARSSVTLALGLIGVMALFLGLMKVAEAGGLLVIIARLLRPLMVRLFPEVPPEHPAMGAMIMNLSANVMGLGNAATPFGIRAMQELDKLNPHKGTATNAMVLFLAVNTSSVTLLPTGVIAIRAAAGSTDPAAIVPTTLFATICSTFIAILAARFYSRFAAVPAPDPVTAPDSGSARLPAGEAVAAVPSAPAEPASATAEAPPGYPTWVSVLALCCILGMVPVTIVWGQTIAPWIIPSLMVGLLTFGALRGVRVYEAFVEGAKDGFEVAVRIIPYLVAILVAVAMFRASGAMDMLIQPLGAVTRLVGLPPEALPMALLRPLSGSGAYGIMVSIINDPEVGPDSYTGLLVSTLQGSTETTFYVLAVYFGAVQIRRIRHALAAGLTADFVGVVAAVAICLWLFG
ncbi:MAG: nucleoside recognition domain-containing protein [Alphaproteobacteria bacterium]